MPKLEPLNLQLTGSAEGLTVALGKAESAVKSAASKMEGTSMGAGFLSKVSPMATVATAALAGVAAAAGTAAGAIYAIKSAMDAIDDTNDAAARLGMTLSELTNTRFSLKKLTGLDEGAIDASLAKFQVNLAEAAQTGSGKAAEALQQLGINAKDLIAQGPLEAFALISDEVAKLPNKADQMRVLFDILGKGGVGLAGAFRDGGDALREAAAEAEKLIKPTAAQAAMVGMANDAWDVMAANINGIFQVIASEFAPLIQILAEDVSGVAQEFAGIGDWAKYAANVVSDLVGLSIDLVEVVTKSIEAIQKGLAGDFAGAWAAAVEAATFNTAGKMQARSNDIRKQAAQDRATGPTEAEIEAADANSNALESTKRAAQAVEQKAQQIEQQAIKPLPVLSAITDRAAQIRSVAEARNQAQADKQNEMLAEQKKTNIELAALRTLFANQREPVPLAL